MPGLASDRTSALVVEWAGRLASGVLGRRGCCFTFHRMAASSVWEGLPNRDFYLDASFLDALLGHLARTGWDVVTMEEAARRSANPNQGGRFVNFSVDDCYRDTFEAVVPLFRRHGVPVTLFVTTGIPDGTLPLWGAGLETLLLERDAVEDGGVTYLTVDAAAKRAAYAAISHRWDGPNVASHYAAFCAAHGTDPETLDQPHRITWDMLQALRADRLVEIGAHTVSHARVSDLALEAATQELEGSRLRLEAMLGGAVRHFAFPYGRSNDCGPRDFALAAACGFATAATTQKGLLRPGAEPHSLPRNTLNGSHRTLWHAEAHLSGAFALAARMTGRV